MPRGPGDPYRGVMFNFHKLNCAGPAFCLRSPWDNHISIRGLSHTVCSYVYILKLYPCVIKVALTKPRVLNVLGNSGAFGR